MARKGTKQTPEHIAKRIASYKARLPIFGKKPGAGRPANTPEVLWSKVQKLGPNECWPWLGFKNKQGYGRTWIGDKGYYAHRVIFDLVNPGLIKLGKRGDQSIRHSCDNPSCCNPGHLLLGTHRDNMQDRKERKRGADFRGTRGGTAKLSEDEVREIRFMKRFATCRALALLYEVSNATIHGCLYGRHYQDVN